MNEDFGAYYLSNAIVLACMWPLFWVIGLGMVRSVFGAPADRWSTGRRLRWSAAVFAAGLIVLLKRAADMGATHFWATSPGLDEILSRQLGVLFSPKAYPEHWSMTWTIFLELLCRGLAVPLLCAVAVKVWLQWTSPPLGSSRGLQRFGLMDLVLAALTAACVAAGTNLNMLPIFVGLTAVLFAWPLINRLSQMNNNKGAEMTTESPGELNDERSRVLKLLEDGKITAPDAAELLAALTASHSVTSPERTGPMSLDRKLGFAGAAIVLIAFFLPWFTIDLGAEISRLGGMLDRSQLPEAMRTALPTAGNFSPATAVMDVHGGDLGHGLGWLALGLAIAAAFVPGMFPHWNVATRRNLRMAAVAAGVILVTYLLTSNGRYANVGVVLAMIGFLTQGVAVGLELRPMLTRTDARPVVAT